MKKALYNGGIIILIVCPICIFFDIYKSIAFATTIIVLIAGQLSRVTKNYQNKKIVAFIFDMACILALIASGFIYIIIS